MSESVAIDAQGWLLAAQRCPSPNYDARPPQATLDLIVVHGISLPPQQFGGPYIEALFRNQLQPEDHGYFAAIHTLRVSSHLLIRRSGAVQQFVSFLERAWHAGQSAWQGRSACNDFSIGIELEGADDCAYTSAQYARLARIVAQLRAKYPTLKDDALTGHEHIAPGRKTDPGPAFDWALLQHHLKHIST